MPYFLDLEGWTKYDRVSAEQLVQCNVPYVRVPPHLDRNETHKARVWVRAWFADLVEEAFIATRANPSFSRFIDDIMELMTIWAATNRDPVREPGAWLEPLGLMTVLDDPDGYTIVTRRALPRKIPDVSGIDPV